MVSSVVLDNQPSATSTFFVLQFTTAHLFLKIIIFPDNAIAYK